MLEQAQALRELVLALVVDLTNNHSQI